MAMIFLDEKRIVDPTQEKRLSTTSSYEVVLHGVPTPPDELYHIVQKRFITSVTIENPDEALPEHRQRCSEDATPRDHFTTAELPTPSISRSSTSITNTHSNLALELAIDRGLTPPLSVHRTSESSLTFDHQQSSKTDANDQSDQKYLSDQSTATEPSHAHGYLLNSAVLSEAAKSTPDSPDVETSKTHLQTKEPILSDIQAITTIGRGCFISNTLLVPENYRAHWTATLKSRIDETLLQELPPSNDNQSSLVLVLRMAGTRRKDLRPSIMVTCCSESKKRGKAVMKIMSQLRKTGGLRGPQGDDLPYFVRVQGGFQLLMAGPGLERPILEARMENSASTMCGVSARFRSSLGLGADDTEVKFTIGGIILINGRRNCLTAAHPFLPSETLADDISDSSLSSTLGDVSETNSIEPDNAEELDTINLPLGGINPTLGVTQDLVFRTLEHGGFCLPYPSQFENSSIVTSVGTSDWAVFLAGDSFDAPQGVNSIRIPGQHKPTFIESTMTKTELREGQVWIAAGSGLHGGVLNPVPASILIRNSICEVREISLTSPLGKLHHILRCL
jgi:hypothetical protein